MNGRYWSASDTKIDSDVTYFSINFIFDALKWLLFRKWYKNWEVRFQNKLKSVDFSIIDRCCWKN